MHVLASTAVLALLMLQTAPLPAAQSRHSSSDARKMTLTLPHALRKGETAWLLVKVGEIDHNEIRITTQDGRLLGTISPFGVHSGQAAGTYTIPIPADAFNHNRIALLLSVMGTGQAPRAPTTKEVKSVRLLIRRFRTRPADSNNP